MINIAIAPDDNYMKPEAVAITSLLENRNDDVCIYLTYLNGALSEDSRRTLHDIAKEYQTQMIFVCLEKEYMQSLPFISHLGFSTYLRLFLPWALPNLDKIIYLDCDVIVEKPLDELYQTDIGAFFGGAVADYFSSYYFFLQSIGYHHSRPYVNAGIFLMNLDRLRQFSIREMLNNYLNEHRHDICYADQDIINVLFPEIYILHPRYNVNPFMWMAPALLPEPWKRKERREAISSPTIIHFLGKEKPWQGYRLRFSERWWHYASLTPPVIKDELFRVWEQGLKPPRTMRFTFYRDSIRDSIPIWLLKFYYKIRIRI